MAENLPDGNTKSFINLTKDTQIGRYRIIERVGVGGMGDVYLAEDTELKRQVALKFLSSLLGTDPSCRARFTREAQAAAKLNHANIVTIHEVGEFGGRPFLAMEYIEGHSLRDLIDRGRLPLTQALDIAIQLCDGLQEAHNKGIVHRDIKPANVIIDNKGRCKLLDFGLATVQGCEGLTQTGSTLGTVNYMSPEQVLAKDVDARSDIFSFGIVLYQMLAGHLPFRGDLQQVMMYSIANDAPIPLQGIVPEASADLYHIINRLLEKSPDDRYQSMADVATELRRLKRDTSQTHSLAVTPPGRLISSKPPTPTSSLMRKIIFAAMATLIVAAVIVLFFMNPFKLIQGNPKRVVVVPFHNQTGDPALDPLGKMIADWTTQGLMQSGMVEVVPLEELPEDNKELGVIPVARSTGAGIIVTGSYYKSGDTLQFQAKVLDAKSRLVKAIEPIACHVGQPMEGVQYVRERVLGALAVMVDERLIGEARVGSTPPRYEAYEQLIKGLKVTNKGWLEARAVTNTGWLEARACFNKAYELDTTFLGALLYVATTHKELGEFAQADSVLQFLDLRRDRLSRLQQLYMDGDRAWFAGDNNKALDAAREAAEIERTDGSYMRLAIQANYSNRPREAIRALKKIEASARGPRSWTQLAAAYDLLQDHKEELKTTRQARELFPTNIDIFNYEIWALAALGKVDAIRKCFEDYSVIVKQDSSNLGEVMMTASMELRAHGYEDSAMAISNQAVKWYECLPPEKMETQRLIYGVPRYRRLSYGWALYAARRWQEANGIFEKIDKGPVDSFEWLINTGVVAARLGDREKALQVSDWLKGIKRPFFFGRPAYNRACIAAILGNKEEAVALLREALSQGYQYYYVHTDMDFESIRDYPPFIELMRPKG